MVTIPGTFVHSAAVRDDLPLIGQVAAPLQSMWMLSFLRQVTDAPDFDQRGMVSDFLNFHNLSHAERWPIVGMYEKRSITVNVDQEPSFQVAIDTPCTVGQLRRACCAMGIDVQAFFAWEQDRLLANDALLRTASIHFHPPLVGCGKQFDLEKQGVPCCFQRQGLDDLTMLQQARRLMQKSGLADTQLWSPRHITSLLEMWPATASDDIKKYLIHEQNFGFLWIDGHWIVFHISVEADTTVARFFDGFQAELPADADILAARFARAAGTPNTIVKAEHCVPQTHGSHCGAVALLNLGVILNLWQQADEATAELWHQMLLSKQQRQGRGKDEAAITMLADILHSKGVPADQLQSRAQAAIRKLTLPVVEKALAAKDPWKALKEAGSLLSKPFQFVQYSELQAHIQSRAATKRGADGKVANQKKPKKIPPTLSLEVDDMELIPGSFVDPAGDDCPVLTIQELVSDAKGVAIVTQEMAKDLRSDSTNLSVDSLAVVTIGELPADTSDRVTAVQWPAVYKPTSEPILVSGSLVQLGDLTVERKKHESAPEVPQLDTTVLRLSVHKDMCDWDWDELKQGPLKFLVARTPQLQYCDGTDCMKNCSKFHAAVDEAVNTVILDAWSWRWSTNDGKQVKIAIADMFGVYLRVPSSGLDSLLKISGWHGLFFEPRSNVSQGSHPAYKVVWLPKNTSLDEAHKKKRNIDVVLGLARMACKLGLRINVKDESMVLKQLYPDSKQVACKVTLTFEVGPLPFGMTREDIVLLLSAWKWLAKPIRPLRSTQVGKYWQVGSEQPPPAPILPTDQGEVTVTLRSQNSNETEQKKVVFASAKTQARMKGVQSNKALSSKAGEAEDSWVSGGDPWQNFKPTSHKSEEVVFTQNQQRPSQEARSRMSQMQQEIHDLKSQLEKTGTEDVHMTSSSLAQSSELQELRAQTKKHESWFAEQNNRMTSFETTLQAQGQQISQLNESMQYQSSATSALQHQMVEMQTSFKDQLASSFDAQNARLEALLEKRSRTS